MIKLTREDWSRIMVTAVIALVGFLLADTLNGLRGQLEKLDGTLAAFREDVTEKVSGIDRRVTIIEHGPCCRYTRAAADNE